MKQLTKTPLTTKPLTTNEASMKKKLNSKLSNTLSCALLLTAATFAGTAQANSFEANLNNDTVQAEIDLHIPNTQNLYVNASMLYTEEQSDHSAIVGAIGVQGVEASSSTYRAAVGGRLYYYDYGRFDGSALALGGLFYHVLPGATRFSAGGYAWFAPKVTSFGDTEQVIELGGRLAFRVIQNTDVFVGYRHLRIKNNKFNSRSFNDALEKGFNAGFRLNF